MSHKRHEYQILMDLWPILSRYRWRFIIPAFMVAAVVLSMSLFLPRRYRGEAVFERRNDMVLTEINNRSGPTTFQDPRQSIMDEVAGPTAINQVVEIFADGKHPASKVMKKLQLDKDALRDEMRRKVSLFSDISTPELDRVRVQYIGPDPELARIVVNGLVENYVERTRSRIEARLKQSSEFFRSEVIRSKQRIAEVETRKLAFELKNASILPHNLSEMMGAGNEFQVELVRLERQKEQIGLRLESLRNNLAATPETIPTVITSRNPELVTLQGRLGDLTSQLNNALNTLRMTDKHPDVSALREQIEQVKVQMANLPPEVVTQRQTTVNPKRAEIELLVSGATAELQSVESHIGAVKKRMSDDEIQAAKVFPIRSEYLTLNREVAEAQRQLAFWEDNLRRVEVASTAESGNRGVQLNFISPCGKLNRPVSPNLGQAVSVAVFLAMLSGALSVFFAYRSNDTFSRAQDMSEAVGLPLFGSVSELISAPQLRQRRFNRMVLFPVNSVAMLLVLFSLGFLLYLDLEKPSLMAELRKQPVQFLIHQIFGGKSSNQG